MNVEAVFYIFDCAWEIVQDRLDLLLHFRAKLSLLLFLDQVNDKSANGAPGISQP